MTTRLAGLSQQAAANAVVQRIDAGTTNLTGRLRIYDDTAATPTDADDSVPVGSVLLAELDLQDPAYGAANTSGVAALQGTLSGTGVGAGTAAWFRVVNRDEATVFQGDVRATADPDNGEELVLDNTNIAVDQALNVNSLNYTQPANEA